jgi:[ribosomal protein S5]-alanine N-acetyltransferase
MKIRALGERVELRAYKISDFKKLRESAEARGPAVDHHDTPVKITTFTELTKYKECVLRIHSLAKDRNQYKFGIFEKKSGEFIGEIGLFVINKQLRWANLGYQLHNQHFGKSYATEAAKLGLKLAFKTLDFHRIEAAMELDNEASKKVAVKIGLEFEGVRKKFFADKGGIDMNVYAANAIDYEG